MKCIKFDMTEMTRRRTNLNKSEKREEQTELIERINKMQQLMKKHYAQDQSLTSQEMLQLSQCMDRYIVAYMKSEKC